MGGKKDKKEKSKKGKANVKGGKVNQPEEIPAEHSDGEEIQEGDQEKCQKNRKINRTEKTDEPQADKRLPEELEGPLPDIEPC